MNHREQPAAYAQDFHRIHLHREGFQQFRVIIPAEFILQHLPPPKYREDVERKTVDFYGHQESPGHLFCMN